MRNRTWIAESGNHFRRARLQRLLQLLDAVGGEIRLLDIGGSPSYWRSMEPLWKGRNIRFTLINIDAVPIDDPPFHVRRGDGRSLGDYSDNSFSIVHSNSVIEHVGRWADMRRMAREVSRLAPSYFIQTPNFWFPVEAHYRLPLVQFLPEPWRARLLQSKTCGYLDRQRDYAEAMSCVQSINLLTESQMRRLFPDSQIYHERVLGLTKSLVAWRISAPGSSPERIEASARLTDERLRAICRCSEATKAASEIDSHVI